MAGWEPQMGDFRVTIGLSNVDDENIRQYAFSILVNASDEDAAVRAARYFVNNNPSMFPLDRADIDIEEIETPHDLETERHVEGAV